MAGLQERGTVQKQGLGHTAVRCDPAPDRNTRRDEGGGRDRGEERERLRMYKIEKQRKPIIKYSMEGNENQKR